jgi:hypothetical protein
VAKNRLTQRRYDATKIEKLKILGSHQTSALPFVASLRRCVKPLLIIRILGN